MMNVQDIDQLTSYLREHKYCLMVDDEGIAIYKDGKLPVCQEENRECVLYVPDCEEIRKLYELPVQSEEEVMLDVKYKPINIEDKLSAKIGSDVKKVNMIWLGQRSLDCQEATKALIEIYGSDKYQVLMNDKNTVKLKIWEKIASDIEKIGYKIGNSPRDAALRTFQKWRNMERTYWKYLSNPDLCGEDKRRKKPTFFDGVDAIIKKRKCYRVVQQLDDPKTPNGEEFPPIAIETLLSMVCSDKYKSLLHESTKNIKLWEDLCKDFELNGFAIAGATLREKSLKLSRKWRKIKRAFITYEHEKNLGRSLKKPMYYDFIHTIASKELFKFKSEEEIDLMDVEEYLQPDHDYEVTLEVSEGENSASALCDTSSCGEIGNLSVNNLLQISPPSTPVVEAPSASPILSTPLPATTSSAQASDHILLEIKKLHETALAAQQQNYSKIISVLEEQTEHLRTLSSMFTQYVTYSSKKSSSRHSRKKDEVTNKSKESNIHGMIEENGSYHDSGFV